MTGTCVQFRHEADAAGLYWTERLDPTGWVRIGGPYPTFADAWLDCEAVAHNGPVDTPAANVPVPDDRPAAWYLLTADHQTYQLSARKLTPGEARRAQRRHSIVTWWDGRKPAQTRIKTAAYADSILWEAGRL
jgi:hypothetical protein